MADGDEILESGVHGFYESGDPRILDWLKEARVEGEGINRADPAFAKTDMWMGYLEGNQPLDKVPPDVPTAVVNMTKKAIRSHISALTDLRLNFAWKTENPVYLPQAELLNNLVKIWWGSAMSDQEVGDCARYSMVAGAGDAVAEFDPAYRGGDTRLSARDPRDTLSIRPARTRILQDWEGVTIREAHSVNAMRSYFTKAAKLFAPDSGKMPAAFTRFGRTFAPDSAPVTTLSGLGAKDPNRRRSAVAVAPDCTFYRTFLKDRTRHLGLKDKPMGKPGTNWFYLVKPGELLYPRGRMILWTELGVVSDGPNPYWHARFPISRLKLDPWPWSFFGLSPLHDMEGIQNSINRLVGYMLQLCSQHVNRGQVWDRNMPMNMRKMFDPRIPNWKIQRPNAFSDGMKLAEVPQFPAQLMPFLTLLFQKFNELTGVAGLEAFLQLRQAPGAETVEKFLEALTPEIRLEGRQIEFFVTDLAEVVKSNIFQFQSASKRFAILGDASRKVEAVDYDPETLVPALAPGDPNYVPELDADLPRHERAKFFSGQFSFYVEPNSMLSLHGENRKMMYLQLSRMGYMDIWTLGEMLEIPNVGAPPLIPLPKEDWDPAKEPPGAVMIDPLNGTAVPAAPPMELRRPQSIPERLQAQAQMGIGAVASPAGRKASGQTPPHAETKGDGRQVVSESR